MKINNETKVGVMAALAVTLLILGFNFLKGDQLFNKSFELKARYDNIDNLAVGNPVLFSGLKVGQVRDIEINKNTGELVVTFTVERGIAIPANSEAEIISSDLLGSKAIRINRGDAGENVKSGAFITGTLQKSLAEQVQDEVLPVKDKLEALIDQFEVFMGKLNNTFDENNMNKIDDMVDNLNATSKSIKMASYRVDTVFRRVDNISANVSSVVKNFRNQNVAVERILNNSATFSDSLAAASTDIRNIVTKVNTSVDNIQSTLDKIENGDGSLPLLLDDQGALYREVTETVEDVDSFIQNPKIKLVHTIGPSDAKLERQRLQDSLKAAQKKAKAEEKARKREERRKRKEERKNGNDEPEPPMEGTRETIDNN